MQNRFLFRGKRKNAESWIIGSLLFCPEDDVIHIATNFWESTAVDPATIGQCTGLRDKKGKLIFEGDILQTGNLKSVICWDEKYARFIAANKLTPPRHFSIPEDGTGAVIGNIHDNPELLEVQNVVVVFDGPHSDKEVKEGLAVHWAVTSGACSACQYLRPCNSGIRFSVNPFPWDAPCMVHMRKDDDK